jgi:hypothetical protein
VVKDEEQAIEAVKQVSSLDRKKVRECFEKRFTSRRMALNYLKVYQRLQKQMKGKENLVVALQDRKLSII